MTESTTDTETRGETEQERINRNWDELLQELRVTQTGVQILTGFLLTLPFQQRFALLDDTQQAVYLTTVGFAVLATGLLVAPVSHHRSVFRQHEKEWLVKSGHRSARVGLVALALAITGAVWVVFDVVLADRWASNVASGCTVALLFGLWWGVPVLSRRQI
jgi:hypothetical protein